jgi:hypothetical protein
MENKKEYPVGIKFSKRHEKSPDFVLGRININREKAIKWLQEKQGEWINLQLLKPFASKDTNGIVGEPYLVVDNWVKQVDFDNNIKVEQDINIQDEEPF